MSRLIHNRNCDGARGYPRYPQGIRYRSTGELVRHAQSEGVAMTPTEFVHKLAGMRMPMVFNPYCDVCPIHDLPDAPARRRSNLKSMIEMALENGIDTLWVGRDLGYRGGRRTGIALTDEPNLTRLTEVFGNGLKVGRATRGPVVAERTASVVWEMISRLQKPVFTWNVFPLHPHPASDPLGNRCHTGPERTAAAPLLRALIEILRPSQIIAIGNDAGVGLESLGIACSKVRHPSYGGIADFRRGMAALHSIEVDASTLHPQFSFNRLV